MSPRRSRLRRPGQSLLGPATLSRCRSRSRPAGALVSLPRLAPSRAPRARRGPRHCRLARTEQRADTIRFDGHGLQSGDQVEFDANGHNPINTSSGPLESLTRDYPVIRVDDNTVQLGETFAGTDIDAGAPFGADSGVDGDRDEISF